MPFAPLKGCRGLALPATFNAGPRVRGAGGLRRYCGQMGRPKPRRQLDRVFLRPPYPSTAPGFRMPFGSNTALIWRIMASFTGSP